MYETNYDELRKLGIKDGDLVTIVLREGAERDTSGAHILPTYVGDKCKDSHNKPLSQKFSGHVQLELNFVSISLGYDRKSQNPWINAIGSVQIYYDAIFSCDKPKIT